MGLVGDVIRAVGRDLECSLWVGDAKVGESIAAVTVVEVPAFTDLCRNRDFDNYGQQAPES